MHHRKNTFLAKKVIFSNFKRFDPIDHFAEKKYRLKKLTQKNKEDNLQMMMRILIDGATQQDHYLNDLARSDAFMNESEEFDIFDV